MPTEAAQALLPIVTVTAAPTEPATPPPPATQAPSPAPSEVPSQAPSQVPSPTPPATATPTSPPTALPTPPLAATTAVPAAAPAVPGSPSPTPSPWPTVNPDFLPPPPATVDLSRGHLWFARPVEGNNVPSSPYRFGMTYFERLAPHHGVDLANNPGTPVVAVTSGTVHYAGEDSDVLFGPRPDFFGRVVVVQADQLWEGHIVYTLYGHLESVAVATGQPVLAGDVLGAVGSAGIALGPHLHFEVRLDDPADYDSVRNPELWYQPFNGRGVLAGRVVDAGGQNAGGRFMPGTRVNLACSDATPRLVDTYWDGSTPPDDVLGENFVVSDLPAGSCLVWTELFGERVEARVDIVPGSLAMVVLAGRP